MTWIKISLTNASRNAGKSHLMRNIQCWRFGQETRRPPSVYAEHYLEPSDTQTSWIGNAVQRGVNYKINRTMYSKPRLKKLRERHLQGWWDRDVWGPASPDSYETWLWDWAGFSALFTRQFLLCAPSHMISKLYLYSVPILLDAHSAWRSFTEILSCCSCSWKRTEMDGQGGSVRRNIALKLRGDQISAQKLQQPELKKGLCYTLIGAH